MKFRRVNLTSVDAYYFLRSDQMSLILLPIILKWEKANLTISQMLLLQGIFAIAITLLEVPTGVISDKLTRTLVLKAGYTLVFLGTILYWGSNSFSGFLIAELIFALALSLISGTLNAYLFEYLVSEQKEAKAKSIFSKSLSLRLGTSVIGILLGGSIYELNNNIPFAMASIIAWMKLSVTFLIPKVENSIQHNENAVRKGDNLIIKAIHAVVYNSRILQVFLLTLFIIVPFKIQFWTYKPLMSGFGFSLELIGLLFALLNCVAILFSYLAKKISISPLNVFIIISLGIFGLWMLALSTEFGPLLIGMIIAQVLRGGVQPVLQVELQKSLSNDIRATVASLISMVSNLVFGMLTFVYNLNNLNIGQVNWLTASLTMLLALLFGIPSLMRIIVDNKVVKVQKPKPLS